MTLDRFTLAVRRTLAVAPAVCLLLASRGVAAQDLFLQNGTLLIGGMATDAEGDLWVSHLSWGSAFAMAMAEDVYATEVSPAGYVKSQVYLGTAQAKPGLTAGELLGRLAFDPTTGLLWHLAAGSFLTKIDTATRRVVEIRSAATLGIDLTRTYDVATRSVRDFTNRIFPADSSYGDIAFHVSRDTQGRQVKDVFMSAVDPGDSLDLYGRVPYIVRIRYVDGVQQSAQVVLSTTAESGRQVRFDGLPRGIGVNRYGLALTTLPVIQVSGEAYDAPVAFPFDFAERCAARSFVACDQMVVVFGSLTASRGVTTDATGRFHVATGMKGSSWCPNSSGAIVRMSPDLRWFSCRSIGTGSALDSWDVAITAAGDASYVNLTDKAAVPPKNSVLRFREPATAAIAFDRLAVDFCTQVVGTESESRSIRLTNVGTGPLTIDGFTIPAHFSERSDCPVGSGSLAPGASCTIEITFAPTNTGPVTGSLTSDNNAFLSLKSVRLSGQGVQ